MTKKQWEWISGRLTESSKRIRVEKICLAGLQVIIAAVNTRVLLNWPLKQGIVLLMLLMAKRLR